MSPHSAIEKGKHLLLLGWMMGKTERDLVWNCRVSVMLAAAPGVPARGNLPHWGVLNNSAKEVILQTKKQSHTTGQAESSFRLHSVRLCLLCPLAKIMECKGNTSNQARYRDVSGGRAATSATEGRGEEKRSGRTLCP